MDDGMARLWALILAFPVFPAWACDPSETLYERLVRHEGYERCVYVDTLGNPTIGVGHLLPEGTPHDTCWDDATIYRMLHHDIEFAESAAYRDLNDPVSWAHLPRVPRETMIEMAFQLGGRGLGSFHHMLDAIRAGDWPRAAREIRNSLLARETPKRANELADCMENASLNSGL